MRYRTIKNRMRLLMIDENTIQKLYKDMKGISDESTLHGEGQKAWINAVRKAVKLYKGIVADRSIG